MIVMAADRSSQDGLDVVSTAVVASINGSKSAHGETQSKGGIGSILGCSYFLGVIVANSSVPLDSIAIGNIDRSCE